VSDVIEIRLTRIEQLFNSLDPSPFHERDLDPEAESHIVGWARELARTGAIVIKIHLPADQIERDIAGELPRAVQNYFDHKALVTGQELKELFRVGWRYLAIGLVVLLGCLAGSQLAQARLGPGPVGDVLSESLLILGWVANWKPLETILYDWLPIRRRLTLYRRLSSATVEVSSLPAATAGQTAH